MSDHLERFRTAYSAIYMLGEDTSFRDPYSTDHIDRRLGRDLDGKTIGVLTRPLDTEGRPTEIRWDHVKLLPDGTLAPESTLATPTYGRNGSVVAVPERLETPGDPEATVESFLRAIENGIAIRRGKHAEILRRQELQRRVRHGRLW